MVSGSYLGDLEPFSEVPHSNEILALLHLQPDLIDDIPDFNNRVIDRFATKAQRTELLYK
jgi:hypothetical protein